VEKSVINSLGSYVQDQLGLLGWSREALIERSGVDRWELEGVLESPVLMEWPTPEVMLGLARAFNVSVRDLVLRAAQGCGLHVEVSDEPMDSLHLLGNDVLVAEMRRRLALGAATGGYLSKPDSYFDADSGAQFT
jgi:hypothetical protein